MRQFRDLKSSIIFLFAFSWWLTGCAPGRNLAGTPSDNLLLNPILRNAHVGISIFDPGSGQYLVEHQGERYFVPASNIKIATCYAAMKWLGDSLEGGRLLRTGQATYLRPTADPSFLHQDFESHPLFSKLKTAGGRLFISSAGWKEDHWGSGWSWNDYEEYYMAERSPFPIYGNQVRWVQEKEDATQPVSVYSIPEVDWEVRFAMEAGPSFRVERALSENVFTLTEGRERKKELSVPFVTNGLVTATELLKDTLLNDAVEISAVMPPGPYEIIYSQPTDSVLMPMMHRSDNFFAEQLLLMVSDRLLGEMKVSPVVDTILKGVLSDLPQKPRWVDGSGLSRYNLFSPRDFITILRKMLDEFGMERIKTIFPTGGEGTLGNYYHSDSGFIYAKTGTLSGVVALSGFLKTDRGKWLIFSTLVNNHQSSATEIRKAVEKFLQEIRRRY
jgi:D-alanyl-D-alanine carboxypeptidase/D-alanyl-D-alanine-endopeptidase (penicillin-binding protein 4)